MGAGAARLSSGQSAAACQCRVAAVAAVAAVGGARRVVRGGGVRGASAARGVGGLGHRAQGRPGDGVLSFVCARLYPLHGNAARAAARRALPAGGGVVRTRPAQQIHRHHAAGGVTALALVAARARDPGRWQPHAAVLSGRAWHRAGRLCLFHQLRICRIRVYAAGARAACGARLGILRRQTAVAGGADRGLSALGARHRRRAGVGLRGRLCGGGWRCCGTGAGSLVAGRWPACCFLRWRCRRCWASWISAICSTRLSPTAINTSVALA